MKLSSLYLLSRYLVGRDKFTLWGKQLPTPPTHKRANSPHSKNITPSLRTVAPHEQDLDKFSSFLSKPHPSFQLSTSPRTRIKMAVTTKATIASFGGKLLKLSHNAKTTNCEMSFNLYLPPQAIAGQKVPLLIYLSGLTCTAENCSEKGFFQHGASKKGIAVLYPDTSPRIPPFLTLSCKSNTDKEWQED